MCHPRFPYLDVLPCSTRSMISLLKLCLCFTVLFTNIVYWNRLPILFTNIVYQYCLPILFTNIVYQYCLPILFTNIVYQYCLPILFTNIVYQYCLPILFTNIVYQYCLPILFTVVYCLNYYSTFFPILQFQEAKLQAKKCERCPL
jgi:hypothetical protein